MLKTALGQNRTVSLVLGAVVPASLGKEAWRCQLSWRHILRRGREEIGAKTKDGNLCKCCPAFSPKYGGSVTSSTDTLEG